MTVNQTISEGSDLSYGDMERLGFDPAFIEDYQSLRRQLAPQSGLDLPENLIAANLSGYYIRLGAPNQLWFNSAAGSKTGWEQLI